MNKLIKKFKIPHLTKNLPRKKESRYVLKKKLLDITEIAEDFLENETPENLHQLRISIRRFRYSMELYYDCYKPSLFFSLYEMVKNFQDLAGKGRDLDVMDEKIRQIAAESDEALPEELLQKIGLERQSVQKGIKTALEDFIGCPIVKLMLKH